jgi:hypothetical protein
MTTAASADVTIDFPLASDTWQLHDPPHWFWYIGDTVFGDRDLGTEEFDYVTVTLPITINGLVDGGDVDLDLRLDGNTVYNWSVVEGDGTGNIVYEGAISYIPTGTEEVRYYQTNTVPTGDGSIEIIDTGGTIEFQTVVGIESASLGEIKAVFK